jgi:hypothetical protein
MKITKTDKTGKPYETELTTSTMKVELIDFLKESIKEELTRLANGEIHKFEIEGDPKYNGGISPSTIFQCLEEMDPDFDWDYRDDNGWQNDVWGSCVFLGKNYEIFYGSYYGHFEIIQAEFYDELL